MVSDLPPSKTPNFRTEAVIESRYARYRVESLRDCARPRHLVGPVDIDWTLRGLQRCVETQTRTPTPAASVR